MRLLLLAACASAAPPPLPSGHATTSPVVSLAVVMDAACALAGAAWPPRPFGFAGYRLGEPVTSEDIVRGDNYASLEWPIVDGGPYLAMFAIRIDQRVARVVVQVDRDKDGLCAALDNRERVPLVWGEPRRCGWQLGEQEVQVTTVAGKPALTCDAPYH